MVKLTVPWEEGVQTAHERKKAIYVDLVAKCREGGWNARLYPVEVVVRGAQQLAHSKTKGFREQH